MAGSGDAQVQFLEGTVIRKDFVVIASRLVSMDEDEEGSRVFTYMGGAWKHFDVDMTVTSICAVLKPTRTVFCLGEDGRIDVSRGGQGSEERIASAGLGPNGLGYVVHMREIAGDLYVCGTAGQIYRRASTGWVHQDDNVLNSKGSPGGPDLTSIDGISKSDIYAVGDHGVIFHSDGSRWDKMESPTTAHLNWVKCVAPEEVYLCGDNGIFFRGSLNRWEKISTPKNAADLWCVEKFENTIYIASDNGILGFDQKKVRWVDVGINEMEGHRLHAKDGVLWSFGTDHLCFFDGKKWTYVPHPDNE